MRSISSELQQAMYQVSQSAYTSAGGDGAGAKKGKDEGVVEGEYTVE
jgi:molecular chaperone DnaK